MQSTLNKSAELSEKTWLLALAVKSKDCRPVHTLLLVEGVRHQARIFRRYALCESTTVPGQGKINIMPETICPADVKKSQQILHKKILNHDSIHYKYWPLSRQSADLLHQDIWKEKRYPPHYYSITARLRAGRRRIGHSCFSWAREKIKFVVTTEINIPVDAKEFIAHIPRRNIIIPQQGVLSRFFLSCWGGTKFSLRPRENSSENQSLLTSNRPFSIN